MDVEDDIGADIALAMRGDTAAPEAGAAAPAAPAAAAAEGAPADAAGARPRAADGKFAAKGSSDTADQGAALEAPRSDAGTTTTDQPAAAGAEAPSGEPIRPPAAWSAVAKSKFSTLDPEVQAEIAKRERDMDKGLAERASELKRYEPFEKVIGPHRNRLAMAGTDEVTYVQSLIAADELLRGPNRQQAIQQIAQMYGINLGQPAHQGQQQPQGAQLPPEYQALAQTVAQLQQSFTQQQSAAQQLENARTQSEIDAFAVDHMYFENVRPDMIAMLKSGISDNLADAYRKACWARDDIRPLLLKEDSDKAAAALRAKANDARQASGSITGSPTPGAAPPSANANGSIEDDVTAAWRAASSRA